MKTQLALAKRGAMLLLLTTISSQPSAIFAQGAAPFTYHGQLNENGAPANGAYDLEFRLFDRSSGGTQQGGIVAFSGQNINNGVFVVALEATGHDSRPFIAETSPLTNAALAVGGTYQAAGNQPVLTPSRPAVTTTLKSLAAPAAPTPNGGATGTTAVVPTATTTTSTTTGGSPKPPTAAPPPRPPTPPPVNTGGGGAGTGSGAAARARAVPVAGPAAGPVAVDREGRVSRKASTPRNCERGMRRSPTSGFHTRCRARGRRSTTRWGPRRGASTCRSIEGRSKWS